MKNLSYLSILAGIFLVLCCFSNTSLANLVDDQPDVGADTRFPLLEPWGAYYMDGQRVDFAPVYGGQIDLDSILHSDYELEIEINFTYLLIWIGDEPCFVEVETLRKHTGGLDFVLPPDYVFATHLPRNLPLEGLDLWPYLNLFESDSPTYESDSYAEISALGSSIVAIPEPTTVLLLGIGVLALRRKMKS